MLLNFENVALVFCYLFFKYASLFTNEQNCHKEQYCHLSLVVFMGFSLEEEDDDE